MPDFNDAVLHKDATELSALLSGGEISSEQLTTQTLAAIEQLNPDVNCYINVAAETALAQARSSDQRRRNNALLSPLDGLTVAVKDNIDIAGMVTTAGLGLTRKPAVSDAFAVAQLRKAGCVFLGKLNMHAVALGATNANQHHGNCYNPLRLTHTPGGSSGGSAAAVAAGLCAFSLGTDTMGSVRVPAAYCGVSGIKPSAGAVSITGTVVLNRQLDNIGPLARSPRDLLLIHRYLAGYDSSYALAEHYDYAEWDGDISNIHCAVGVDLQSASVEKSVMAEFHRAVDFFKTNVASTVEVSLKGVDFGAIRRAGLILCEADMLVQQQKWIDEQPQAYPGDLLKLLDWVSGKSAVDAMRAETIIDQAGVAFRALLDEVDVLLLPTTPQPAFDFTEPVPSGQADLTALASVAGLPAVSVPMGLAANGMPVGLQLIANKGADRKLLQLADWYHQNHK